MKFSLNYKSKHNQEADEIRCPINQLGLIFPFIKEHANKRYNIILNKPEIPVERIIQQVEFVKGVADYTVECRDIAIFRGFVDNGYKAYLRFPITDWENFKNLVQLKASDIYIDGPLCFQSEALIKAKEDSNINIRISPTISPNANMSVGSNANSFFIRPEDLSLYEQIIDIIDFRVEDQEKEDTLYDIYTRRTFNFDLQQLIPHLHIKAPNLFIRSDFTKSRMNCGQRCNIPNRQCHFCDTQLTITNTLLDYLKNSEN